MWFYVPHHFYSFSFLNISRIISPLNIIFKLLRLIVIVMDEGLDNSRLALKIVLVLSVLLVGMDCLEIYFSFDNLIEAANKFDPFIFENCIKYHILSQIVFTVFATFAGISAFFMSMGLLVNYEFFSNKLLETFLFWNYIIFGPYLLAACILGYVNFSLIAFNCDRTDISQKYINFSTLMALIICFLLSIIITIMFAFLTGARVMILSITFQEGGWHCLGRRFWNYVFNRSEPHEDRLENNLNEPFLGQNNRVLPELMIEEEKKDENQRHSR